MDVMPVRQGQQFPHNDVAQARGERHSRELEVTADKAMPKRCVKPKATADEMIPTM